MDAAAELAQMLGIENTGVKNVKKLFCHCLAYNDPKLVEEALDHFDKTKGGYPTHGRIIVDQHWPLIPQGFVKGHRRVLQNHKRME